MVAVGVALVAAGAAGATRTDLLREKLLSDDRSYVFVALHRGDWRNFHESSRESILSAIALGADIVELDARMTKDGRFVLVHDPAVDRVTDGTGRVEDLTLAEIKRLRLVKDGRPTESEVLTLEEALALAQGRILVNIDKFDEHPREIVETVVRAGAVREVIVKSTLPPGEAKRRLGEHWRLVESGELLYMPVVQFCWGHHAHAAAILPQWLDELDVAAPDATGRAAMMEVCFDAPGLAASVLRDLARRERPPRLWLNTMWDSLCAGHADARALLDPAANWGWCLDCGATMLQSDCGAELLLYLTRLGRHTLEGGAE